jgi:predicted HicB family RNase H-like nuclease
MTPLSYKGYQGEVVFEDGSLIIALLHIDDIIIGECTDSRKVEQVFRDLVDDYLATCKELGKDPCKQFKGSFNVRMTPERHRDAVMAASRAGKSLNAWVSDTIAKEVAAEQKPKFEFEHLVKLARAMQEKTAGTGWREYDSLVEMSGRRRELDVDSIISVFADRGPYHA